MPVLNWKPVEIESELFRDLKKELETIMLLVMGECMGVREERSRVEDARAILRKINSSVHLYGPRVKKRICSIDECGRPHAARGWCFRHWSQLHRRQRPLSSSRVSVGFDKEDLIEDEFCRFKDLRSQGFSVRDISLDMRKQAQVIYRAWEYETYAHYRARTPDFNEEEDNG